jgi:endonuclease/exonuclease/phosphatase family metal-dependent hydrolase
LFFFFYCVMSPVATIAVVTYNVLNPKLCTTEWFPNCRAEALDASRRLAMVQDKICQWTQKGCVICLQEVSRQWYDLLLPLFSNTNYDCVFAEYAPEWQDYMGILTAWPKDRFYVRACNTSRLVDLTWSRQLRARVASTPKNHLTTTLPDSWWRKLFDMLWAYFREGMRRFAVTHKIPAPKPSTHDLVFSAPNRVIWVQLGCVTTPFEFCVTNYHMPCKYWDNEFMTLHTHMLGTAATQMSGTLPSMLVGDFNLERDAAPFGALLGELPKSSVMAEVVFTCRTENIFNGTLKKFQGQLDHAISWGWRHMTRKDFSTDLTDDGPLPNLQEPSDHLPLFVELWPPTLPQPL